MVIYGNVRKKNVDLAESLNKALLERRIDMQPIIPKILKNILNVVVTVFSFFFFGLAVSYIYSIFVPAVGITTTTSIIPVIPGLILLGSLVYYFITNQLTMKIISSVGTVSMVVFLILGIYL